jgi:hypothetical protein
MDVDGLLGALGRIFLPERVDQPIVRDDLVRMQEQYGEERTLLRSPWFRDVNAFGRPA